MGVGSLLSRSSTNMKKLILRSFHHRENHFIHTHSVVLLLCYNVVNFHRARKTCLQSSDTHRVSSNNTILDVVLCISKSECNTIYTQQTECKLYKYAFELSHKNMQCALFAACNNGFSSNSRLGRTKLSKLYLSDFFICVFTISIL